LLIKFTKKGAVKKKKGDREKVEKVFEEPEYVVQELPEQILQTTIIEEAVFKIKTFKKGVRKQRNKLRRCLIKFKKPL